MGSPRIQPFIPRWTTGRRSVVTLLIVTSVLAFIAQTFAEMASPGFTSQYLYLSQAGIGQGSFWQFLSSQFVHGLPTSPVSGCIHLFIDMTVLYFVGRDVEAIAGPRHLLGMFFASGFVGGLAQLAVSPVPATGASSGVCAVLIAFTMILPEYEVRPFIFLVVPVKVRAKYLAWMVVGGALAAEAAHWSPGMGCAADLGGCLVGWAYARQLGFGNPWWLQRKIMERRQREERLERMSPAQYMVEEIDPILDKIARDGIRSLTRGERRILERGREKISRRETAGSVR